jgi:hypothetical protein
VDHVLNSGFFIFHTAWVLLVCLGWIWRRTRPWQLAAATITAASWVGFGPWFGWGYCPCTDWHWQVRARLGYTDPPSYTELLIADVLGIEVSTSTANAVAVTALAGSTLLGVALAWRVRRARD